MTHLKRLLILLSSLVLFGLAFAAPSAQASEIDQGMPIFDLLHDESYFLQPLPQLAEDIEGSDSELNNSLAQFDEEPLDFDLQPLDTSLFDTVSLEEAFGLESELATTFTSDAGIDPQFIIDEPCTVVSGTESPEDFNLSSELDESLPSDPTEASAYKEGQLEAGVESYYGEASDLQQEVATCLMEKRQALEVEANDAVGDLVFFVEKQADVDLAEAEKVIAEEEEKALAEVEEITERSKIALQRNYNQAIATTKAEAAREDVDAGELEKAIDIMLREYERNLRVIDRFQDKSSARVAKVSDQLNSEAQDNYEDTLASAEDMETELMKETPAIVEEGLAQIAVDEVASLEAYETAWEEELGTTLPDVTSVEGTTPEVSVTGEITPDGVASEVAENQAYALEEVADMSLDLESGTLESKLENIYFSTLVEDGTEPSQAEDIVEDFKFACRCEGASKKEVAARYTQHRQSMDRVRGTTTSKAEMKRNAKRVSSSHVRSSQAPANEKRNGWKYNPNKGNGRNSDRNLRRERVNTAGSSYARQYSRDYNKWAKAKVKKEGKRAVRMGNKGFKAWMRESGLGQAAREKIRVKRGVYQYRVRSKKFQKNQRSLLKTQQSINKNNSLRKLAVSQRSQVAERVSDLKRRLRSNPANRAQLQTQLRAAQRKEARMTSTIKGLETQSKGLRSQKKKLGETGARMALGLEDQGKNLSKSRKRIKRLIAKNKLPASARKALRRISGKTAGQVNGFLKNNRVILRQLRAGKRLGNGLAVGANGQLIDKDKGAKIVNIDKLSGSDDEKRAKIYEMARKKGWNCGEVYADGSSPLCRVDLSSGRIYRSRGKDGQGSYNDGLGTKILKGTGKAMDKFNGAIVSGCKGITSGWGACKYADEAVMVATMVTPVGFARGAVATGVKAAVGGAGRVGAATGARVAAGTSRIGAGAIKLGNGTKNAAGRIVSPFRNGGARVGGAVRNASTRANDAAGRAVSAAIAAPGRAAAGVRGAAGSVARSTAAGTARAGSAIRSGVSRASAATGRGAGRVSNGYNNAVARGMNAISTGGSKVSSALSNGASRASASLGNAGSRVSAALSNTAARSREIADRGIQAITGIGKKNPTQTLGSVSDDLANRSLLSGRSVSYQTTRVGERAQDLADELTVLAIPGRSAVRTVSERAALLNQHLGLAFGRLTGTSSKEMYQFAKSIGLNVRSTDDIIALQTQIGSALRNSATVLNNTQRRALLSKMGVSRVSSMNKAQLDDAIARTIGTEARYLSDDIVNLGVSNAATSTSGLARALETGRAGLQSARTSFQNATSRSFASVRGGAGAAKTKLDEAVARFSTSVDEAIVAAGSRSQAVRAAAQANLNAAKTRFAATIDNLALRSTQAKAQIKAAGERMFQATQRGMDKVTGALLAPNKVARAGRAIQNGSLRAMNGFGGAIKKGLAAGSRIKQSVKTRFNRGGTTGGRSTQTLGSAADDLANRSLLSGRSVPYQATRAGERSRDLANKLTALAVPGRSAARTVAERAALLNQHLGHAFARLSGMNRRELYQFARSIGLNVRSTDNVRALQMQIGSALRNSATVLNNTQRRALLSKMGASRVSSMNRAQLNNAIARTIGAGSRSLSDDIVSGAVSGLSGLRGAVGGAAQATAAGGTRVGRALRNGASRAADTRVGRALRNGASRVADTRVGRALGNGISRAAKNRKFNKMAPFLGTAAIAGTAYGLGTIIGNITGGNGDDGNGDDGNGGAAGAAFCENNPDAKKCQEDDKLTKAEACKAYEFLSSTMTKRKLKDKLADMGLTIQVINNKCSGASDGPGGGSGGGAGGSGGGAGGSGGGTGGSGGGAGGSGGSAGGSGGGAGGGTGAGGVQDGVVQTSAKEVLNAPPALNKEEVVEGIENPFANDPGTVEGDAGSAVALRIGDTLCSAVVIDPEWLLTAAHCVYSDTTNKVLHPVESIQAIIGQSNISSPEYASITEIITHPKYTAREKEFDIALLRLSEKTDVSVMKIAEARDSALFSEGKRATVAGWGIACKDCKPSSDISLRAVTITNRDFCAESYKGAKPSMNITENMICAQGVKRDVCTGDSGGPMSVKVRDQEELVGLVSFGVGCNNKKYPGVYTYLPNLSTWIGGQIVNELRLVKNLSMKKKKSLKMKKRIVRVTNSSNFPVLVKDVAIKGAPKLNLVKRFCEKTLEPGEKCNLVIRFRGKGKSKQNGSITITGGEKKLAQVKVLAISGNVKTKIAKLPEGKKSKK